MKKKIITFIAGAFCLLQVQAQQVVNLTTASSGAVTDPDPIWTLTMPDGTSAIPRISNDLIATGTLTSDAYAHNACGHWISPYVITTPGTTFGAMDWQYTQIGDFDYRATFSASSTCTISNAIINLTNVAADNTITKIIVNGHEHAVTGPGLYTFTSINLNVTADVVNGMNTIDVIVDNYSAYTGMLLCGDLTINYASPFPLVTGASQLCDGDALTFSGAGSSGYIQSYNWAISECDAGGNVIVGGHTWNHDYTGTPGSFTFGSFIGFTPLCGHYYLVKLTLSNGGCTTRVSNSKMFYLKCKPTVSVTDPSIVCAGSDITLSVSGTATSYTWTPTNQTGNAVHVFPTTNTTYTVTGTLNGCTSTAAVHATVAPQHFDVDLSTGIDNSTGTLIPYSGYDDTWKIRGTPGALSSLSYLLLPKPYVSQPYSGLPSSWVSSSTEQWITTQVADSYGNPVQVPASQTDNSPSYDNDYYFETQFNLPWNGYSNLRIELNDVAVDNDILLYLNSNVLTGTPNNMEYQLNGAKPESNFNTMHHPGTVATNQTHYVVGTNKVIAEVANGGGGSPCSNCSYLGLIMNAHVKGECVATVGGGKTKEISDQDMVAERTEATTFVYPNPSAGTFTIRCEDQTILSIIVRNQLGQVVKTVEGVNASSADLSLDQAQKGFYFVEIRYKEQQKPVFRKVVIE